MTEDATTKATSSNIKHPVFTLFVHSLFIVNFLSNRDTQMDEENDKNLMLAEHSAEPMKQEG